MIIAILHLSADSQTYSMDNVIKFSLFELLKPDLKKLKRNVTIRQKQAC